MVGELKSTPAVKYFFSLETAFSYLSVISSISKRSHSSWWGFLALYRN